jgi:hypothetical protein
MTSVGVSELVLSPSVTRRQGPGALAVYLVEGKPLLVRGGFVDAPYVRSFLAEQGVEVVIDLRKPEGLRARDTDGASPLGLWPVLSLPLAPLDAGSEGERERLYASHADSVRDAAAEVAALIRAELVPFVHCRRGVDRTGAVVATVLAPLVGIEVAAEDFSFSAAQAGFTRSSRLVVPFLA